MRKIMFVLFALALAPTFALVASPALADSRHEHERWQAQQYRQAQQARAAQAQRYHAQQVRKDHRYQPPRHLEARRLPLYRYGSAHRPVVRYYAPHYWYR